MNDFKYRSMELLRRIKPDIADRLTRCFVAGSFVIYEFDKITAEYLNHYLLFVELLSAYYTDEPEKYLGYPDVDTALDDFIDAAQGLAILEIPERYEEFRKLTNAVIDIEYQDEIVNYDHYDSKDIDYFRNLIEFFAGWLGISPTERDQIATEEFQAVKQKWFQYATQTGL